MTLPIIFACILKDAEELSIPPFFMDAVGLSSTGIEHLTDWFEIVDPYVIGKVALVDDRSEDGTLEIAREHCDLVDEATWKNRQGFSRFRNKALELARELSRRRKFRDATHILMADRDRRLTITNETYPILQRLLEYPHFSVRGKEYNPFTDEEKSPYTLIRIEPEVWFTGIRREHLKIPLDSDMPVDSLNSIHFNIPDTKSEFYDELTKRELRAINRLSRIDDPEKLFHVGYRAFEMGQVRSGYIEKAFYIFWRVKKILDEKNVNPYQSEVYRDALAMMGFIGSFYSCLYPNSLNIKPRMGNDLGIPIITSPQIGATGLLDMAEKYGSETATRYRETFSDIPDIPLEQKAYILSIFT